MEYTRTRAPCIYACVYKDSRRSTRSRGSIHVGASVLINNAWAFPFPSTRPLFNHAGRDSDTFSSSPRFIEARK